LANLPEVGPNLKTVASRIIRHRTLRRSTPSGLEHTRKAHRSHWNSSQILLSTVRSISRFAGRTFRSGCAPPCKNGWGLNDFQVVRKGLHESNLRPGGKSPQRYYCEAISLPCPACTVRSGRMRSQNTLQSLHCSVSSAHSVTATSLTAAELQKVQL